MIAIADVFNFVLPGTCLAIGIIAWVASGWKDMHAELKKSGLNWNVPTLVAMAGLTIVALIFVLIAAVVEWL